MFTFQKKVPYMLFSIMNMCRLENKKQKKENKRTIVQAYQLSNPLLARKTLELNLAENDVQIYCPNLTKWRSLSDSV